MSADKLRLEYLFERYFSGTATTEERAELAGLVRESNDHDLTNLLTGAWGKFETADAIISPEKTKLILQHIVGASRHSEHAIVRRMFLWRRVAVAASIILMLGVGSYLLFFNNPAKQTEIVKKEESHDIPAPDVARATLKLNDGKIVYLDSAKNGSLAAQGKVNVVKLADGKIAYNGIGDEGLYNTLTNPRGSKVVSLILNDGSKVWLNAASSLTYPTAFAGRERKVSITGEAYFEVAHDDSKPFIVTKDKTSVHVLGTHFNVNAYDDENDIKVTLLEGSVKVNSGAGTALLKPGEQAQAGAGIKVVNGADLQQVMAWKNGMFNFDGTNIEEILRQVERWYNVKIEYKVKTDGLNFSGVVSRKENVSEILKIMELTGLIHFTIEGNRITVTK